MIATIRQIQIGAVSVSAFEKMYGCNGTRATLLRDTQGFIGTELVKKHGERGVYLSIDTWISEGAFQSAQLSMQAHHIELEDRCEDMLASDIWMGMFSVIAGSIQPLAA